MASIGGSGDKITATGEDEKASDRVTVPKAPEVEKPCAESPNPKKCRFKRKQRRLRQAADNAHGLAPPPKPYEPSPGDKTEEENEYYPADPFDAWDEEEQNPKAALM